MTCISRIGIRPVTAMAWVSQRRSLPSQGATTSRSGTGSCFDGGFAPSDRHRTGPFPRGSEGPTSASDSLPAGPVSWTASSLHHCPPAIPKPQDVEIEASLRTGLNFMNVMSGLGNLSLAMTLVLDRLVSSVSDGLSSAERT